MKALTKAEEEILLALWRIDRGFLKDIRDALPEPRPHANTVATVLRILIEKGYVAFEALGRNHLYKAKVNREQYAKRSVAALLKQYFDGSPANVVSHFLRNKSLSVAELEAILKQVKSEK